MAHNIDLDRTLEKLNSFGEYHGLGRNNYQKVYVKGKKLMAEYTSKKRKFLFWDLKPEKRGEQIWVSLDEDFKAIKTAMGEDTVVVYLN